MPNTNLSVNNNPLVSIIVPCYNQAEFLNDTLESVHSQTFENWECIIVNDGSKDNSEEIALRWVNSDKRFKYIKQENAGVSSARNKGISEAKGVYILPLDGDNLLSKDYLSVTTAAIESDPSIKMVYTDAEKFGEENGFWQLYDYTLERLLVSNTMDCTGLFRREDFLKTEGYSEEFREGLEDWEFWISFLADGGKVVKMPAVHFYYRTKKSSRSKDWNEELIKRMKTKMFLKHIELYAQKLGNPVDVYQERMDLKLEVENLKHKLRILEKTSLVNHFKHEVKMFFKKIFV